MCYAGKPTESVVIVKKKKEKAIAIIRKLCFTFFWLSNWKELSVSCSYPKSCCHTVVSISNPQTANRHKCTYKSDFWKNLRVIIIKGNSVCPPPPIKILCSALFSISQWPEIVQTIEKMLTKILKRKSRCIMGDLKKQNAWSAISSRFYTGFVCVTIF